MIIQLFLCYLNSWKENLLSQIKIFSIGRVFIVTC